MRSEICRSLLSFDPISAGNGTGEQTLRHILHQRNSSRQCMTKRCKLPATYYLLSSPPPQRPYVMRSSTPANEILQTFHKVHPSYPAGWSLEMKSLLRKVNQWHVHNAECAVGEGGAEGMHSCHWFPNLLAGKF